MDYKKSVKQAFDASLGDYMVYNEGTGHRLIEGQDFMMTGACLLATLYLSLTHTKLNGLVGHKLLGSVVALPHRVID